MARAIITPELSDMIRSMRLQNRYTSSELANSINKSTAFISRIENGIIKTIDTDDLYRILKELIKENSESKIAEDIYNSLTIKYTSEEIKNQLWFTNYETVKCQIPIPVALIDDINTRLMKTNATRELLLQRINSNESLPEKEAKNESIPLNQWYTSKLGDQSYRSIKIHITEKQLSSILNKSTQSCAYIFIMAISFYLFKIERYNEKITLTDAENLELMNTVTNYLNSYKYYSTSEKNRLLRGAKSQEEYRKILTSFDVEYYDLIIDIISGIKYASERNISDTNDKLRAFDKNMHWDLGFMLKIISLGYSDLEAITVTEKKKLIQDIEKIIKDYKDRNDGEQSIEYY